MSKLIEKTQFEYVIKEVWKKAKAKFVENVELVQETDATDNQKQKYKIQVTKGGATTTKAPFLVTEWKDLQHTTKNDIANLNLLNYESKIVGKRLDGGKESPTILDDNTCSMVYVDIERGSSYTVFKRNDDNTYRCYFLTENNTVVDTADYGRNKTTDNNWTKIVIPSNHINNVNIKKLAIIFKHDTNNSQQMMAFKGDKTLENENFIPYTGKQILVDSREVSLSYSSDNDFLSSKTIHEAIEELSGKTIKQSTLDDYAHKDKDIALNGKVTLANGYITNTPISVQNPTTFNQGGGGMSVSGYTVHEYTNARANTKITRLVVGMIDGVQVGQRINNIYVGVKEQDSDNVKEYFLKDYSTIVVENPIVNTESSARVYPISSEKVVILPVNRTYEYDAPFIISVPNMIWGGRNTSGAGQYQQGKANAGNNRPGEGQPLPNYQTGGNPYIGRIAVYGEDLPMKHMATTELAKDQVLGGKVVHVNGVISGKNELSINNTNATSPNMNSKFFFVCGELTGAETTTTISQVVIGVDSRIQEGTVLRSVNIGKASQFDASQYFIGDRSYVIKDGVATVHKNTNKYDASKNPKGINAEKVITVDVNFTLARGERVFVGVAGMLIGDSTSAYSYSGTLPNAGTTTLFPNSNRQGKTGQVILQTAETPLNKLIRDVEWTGNQGTGNSNKLVFHRADGTKKEIWMLDNNPVPPTSPLLEPLDRVGEMRKFVYDISETAIPSTYSSSLNDDVLDTKENLPVVSNKFQHITGTKIEMDGGVWLKCTGQQLDNLISGKTITLPTSKEFDYMFVCLGAIDYEQETQPSN